ADPADYQLDADALPPRSISSSCRSTRLAASTPGTDPPTVFGTVAASRLLRHVGRSLGSTLGRGGLLLLIAGSGLLTAAALHHFCKEPARRQLLDRLCTHWLLHQVVLAGLRGSCCPAGIAHSRRLERGASGAANRHGAAAGPFPALRTGGRSTEPAAHGVPETRPHAYEFGQGVDIANTADPRQARLQIEASPRCRRGASRRAGIRSLTLSMGLGLLEEPLI
uniref:T200B protein n=1 Tax=Macrostomum lignano TaxID=282301 RepID=A0A1I8FM26_9PLAT